MPSRYNLHKTHQTTKIDDDWGLRSAVSDEEHELRYEKKAGKRNSGPTKCKERYP